tara:strand:+ start:120 stop:464 length:345 start_codon:yes stop_codon:yes gene_type:complete
MTETNINIILDDLVTTSLRSPSSEKTLFLAVILQALLDATKPQYSGEPEQSGLDRRSAKAWFTASAGVTAQDFITVCDLAGVDPSYTRTFSYKIIESKEVVFVRKRINALLTHS